MVFHVQTTPASGSPPANAAPSTEVDIVRDANGTRRVLVKNFDVTLDTPGTIKVTLKPKTGDAVISAAVLEPVLTTPAD